MNMLELLNPVHEMLGCDDDCDRREGQLQVADNGSESPAAGMGSAEAAAVSLMLLGQQEGEARHAPQPLSISRFSTVADLDASTEGLLTPVSSAGNLTLHQLVVGTQAATSSSAAPPSAPHLSPLSDKLHQLVSWGAHGGMETILKTEHALQQLEQNKRPRYAHSSTTRPNKIEDLFTQFQAAPSTPLRAAHCANPVSVFKTESTINSHEAMDESNEQLYSPCVSSGQYCAVTGCLRVAQHMEKCAVHKGMKLCCMSGCFRPVQSRGFCKSHGGGARCKHPGCKKGAISKGRCRTHGGGTRCAIPSCSKWAQRFGCCVRHSKTFAASATVSAVSGGLV